MSRNYQTTAVRATILSKTQAAGVLHSQLAWYSCSWILLFCNPSDQFHYIIESSSNLKTPWKIGKTPNRSIGKLSNRTEKSCSVIKTWERKNLVTLSSSRQYFRALLQHLSLSFFSAYLSHIFSSFLSLPSFCFISLRPLRSQEFAENTKHKTLQNYQEKYL